jgi:hypothetical protein
MMSIGSLHAQAVIPAKAGMNCSDITPFVGRLARPGAQWTPACAGVTNREFAGSAL